MEQKKKKEGSWHLEFREDWELVKKSLEGEETESVNYYCIWYVKNNFLFCYLFYLKIFWSTSKAKEEK